MSSLDQLLGGVDEAEGEIVALLAELVRYPSINTGVMPTGDELPLCERLQRRLSAEGIEASILKSAENRGNLVARLHGSGGGPRLLLMGHLDVVPVEDENAWRYPPFSATIADGRLWGRGASDMKDLVAAELMAAIILKRAGVRLAGDLIVASAADEETGGDYGFGWLARNAPEAITADYAINETGGGPIQTPKGLAYTIQVGEKGRLEARITLHGRAAHAASPWMADNVAFKLAEVICRIAAYQPELDTSQPLFDRLPALLDLPESITSGNVDAVAARLQKDRPALASLIRGMSRMTLTPTMFSGGVKSNSIPSCCTLVCDVRTLPHQDEAYVRRQIDGILEGIEGASYELAYTAVPGASPYDTPLAAALRRATSAAAGRNDLIWLPSLVTGFTDSRLVRPLGIVTYGFGPAHPDADLTILGNAHGANESTDLRSLIFKTKILVALAYELLGEGQA